MQGNGSRRSSDYGSARPTPALRWVTDPLDQWPSMSWPVRRRCPFPPPSDRPSIPASWSARLDVQATQRAAGQVRRFTRSVLTLWTTEDTDIDTAELLASELMTNAVRATVESDRTDDWVLSVGLYQREGHLLLVVVDADGSPPVKRLPGHDDETGRGLLLVTSLARSWGYRLLAGGGKAVWCELETTPTTHHDAAQGIKHSREPAKE